MKAELSTRFESLGVDRESAVIRGVSVVTVGEAKGHGIHIDATSLEQMRAVAAEFKDGVRVKVEHKTGFESMVGVLKTFRVDGNHLRADLHLVKSHPRFDAIAEMAEKFPGSFGLSAVFSYNKEEMNGKAFVRPQDIFSVDLVDAPAANPNGLFSARVDSTALDNDMNVTEFAAELKGMFTGELAQAKARVTELETNLAGAQSKVTELEAKISQTASELSTAKQSVETLTKERDEFKAKSEKVDEIASLKAREIVAAQGVTQPVPVKAGEDKPEVSELEEARKLTGLAKVIALEKIQSKNKK